MKEKKEKLNNSQVKVMQLLWENGATTAKNLCVMAAERYEWNKNTTYTIIKSLVENGVEAVVLDDSGYPTGDLTAGCTINLANIMKTVNDAIAAAK